MLRYMALATLALALSGCATFGGQRSPADREQDRATLELLLKYCDLTANVDMELGLTPRTGAALKAGGTCRRIPADQPAPVSEGE